MDMVGLSAKVDEAKWVLDLYWEYVKKARDEPPPAWMELPQPPEYQAAEDCMRCHETEYKQWLTTPHASAFATLKKAGKQDDPECILCHTMGFGRKGGFWTMEKTPELGRVTCQACHLVTASHGHKFEKGNEMLDAKANVSPRTCMTCHTLVESTNFDYATYKPWITHIGPRPTEPLHPPEMPAKKM
jgi:hypothetical protein